MAKDATTSAKPKKLLWNQAGPEFFQAGGFGRKEACQEEGDLPSAVRSALSTLAWEMTRRFGAFCAVPPRIAQFTMVGKASLGKIGLKKSQRAQEGKFANLAYVTSTCV